jgi:hypothetical protein
MVPIWGLAYCSQTLLQRDVEGMTDPKGPIWGVPYRWGNFFIAYRRDKLERNGIPPIKVNLVPDSIIFASSSFYFVLSFSTAKFLQLLCYDFLVMLCRTGKTYLDQS